MSSTHGIPREAWNAAKAEVREVLIARARVRGMITYSELVREVKAVPFEAYDARLFALLGELSADEDHAGRGMLSALVVHKTGDMEPGVGFFELANSLGRNTTDVTKCWVDEMHKVHRVWAE